MRPSYKVTIAGREYSLDFRLGKDGYVRPLERLARELVGDPSMSISHCYDRLQSTDVLIAVVWGGIAAKLAPEKLSPDDVADRVQDHLDQGGSLVQIRKQVRRAMLASGVIGDFTQQQIDERVPPDDVAAAVVPQ